MKWMLKVLVCFALDSAQAKFEPTRESLSRHEVPEWYQDAKIGFFYHWGPGSVAGLEIGAHPRSFWRMMAITDSSANCF
jgi:hypothetical protein